MSSSVLGFSPWRRRASSLSSHRDREAADGLSPPAESALSVASARLLSSSVGSPKGARPIRSYIHASVRDQLAPVDSNQNARSVREDTAELASYLLSDGSAQRLPSFLHRPRVPSRDAAVPDRDASAGRADADAHASQTIVEVSEPPSPEDGAAGAVADDDSGPSVLSNLLKRSPPQSVVPDAPISSESRSTEPRSPRRSSDDAQPSRQRHEAAQAPATEQTPLLSEASSQDLFDAAADMEGQKSSPTLVSVGGCLQH